MNHQISLNSSIGLRHVIEDGIAILAGTDIGNRRKDYVLHDLATLLKDATHGSELANRISLFVSREERTAFDTFSFLTRYLNENDDGTYSEKIRIAMSTFQSLLHNEPLNNEMKLNTSSFLSELISSMHRQDSTGIQSEPSELQISSL